MKPSYKKILLSVSTFLFALFAFTGATLAWFNLSDEVTVSGFDMEITTGENLKIEISPGVYSNGSGNLNNPIISFPTLFQSQHGYTVGKVRLEALTSLDGDKFYVRQLGGVYQDDAYEHIPGAIYLSYYDLNLKFKSMSDTSLMNVHLNTGTFFERVQGDPAMIGTLRIAFIVDGVTLMIYEQDAPVQKSNSFLPGYGLGEEQITTSARYDNTIEAAINSFLFSLDTNQEKTLTLRIWLEGWDDKTSDEFWKVTSIVKTYLVFKGIPQE